MPQHTQPRRRPWAAEPAPHSRCTRPSRSTTLLAASMVPSTRVTASRPCPRGGRDQGAPILRLRAVTLCAPALCVAQALAVDPVWLRTRPTRPLHPVRRLDGQTRGCRSRPVRPRRTVPATGPFRASIARRAAFHRRPSGAAGPFRTERLAYAASRRRIMRLAALRSREVAPHRTAGPRCAAESPVLAISLTSANHIDSNESSRIFPLSPEITVIMT